MAITVEDLFGAEATRKIDTRKVKKRKVIQIAVIGEHIISLCDDGTMFSSYKLHGWNKLPEIPQD